MGNAKYICSETVELSGQVVELIREVNTLIESAGGIPMFEQEPEDFDIEEATEGMSVGDMVQWNLDAVLLLSGLKAQLLRMMLKLRGVK